MVLILAGQKRDDLFSDIAKAVADVARSTSWQDLRPFLVASGAKIVAVAVLYSGFVFILTQTAG